MLDFCYLTIGLLLDVHKLLFDLPDDDLVAGAELLQLLRLREGYRNCLLLRVDDLCQVLYVELLSHAPQLLDSELLVQSSYLLRQLLDLFLVRFLLLLALEEVRLQVLD